MGERRREGLESNRTKSQNAVEEASKIEDCEALDRLIDLITLDFKEIDQFKAKEHLPGKV